MLFAFFLKSSVALSAMLTAFGIGNLYAPVLMAGNAIDVAP